MEENNFDPKKILDALREHDGGIQKAANKAGLNRNNLVKILEGKWKNWRVVKCAAEVLKALDDEEKEAKEFCAKVIASR